MIRPKFGFYRSLEDTGSLRDESVRIADLCIGEGDSCHYDALGNPYTPPVNLSEEWFLFQWTESFELEKSY